MRFNTIAPFFEAIGKAIAAGHHLCVLERDVPIPLGVVADPRHLAERLLAALHRRVVAPVEPAVA